MLAAAVFRCLVLAAVPFIHLSYHASGSLGLVLPQGPPVASLPAANLSSLASSAGHLLGETSSFPRYVLHFISLILFYQ
ncbi:hypothetical protein C8J56DRAFT_112692 [Mycena floridula]|nr:hypothetical protein C8J56DRAFT_112692 [Mycena floridula]